MQPTHHIIRIEAAQTKNGSPMWRCLTDTGERVNLFKHTDPLKNNKPFEAMAEAGYEDDLTKLQLGQVLHWKQHPIPVIMAKDNDWWGIVAVEKRADGAEADSPYVPDAKLYRQYAIQWAKQIRRCGDQVVYFDTETTGTREDDEIIQFGAWDGINTIDTLLKPTNPERLTMPIWGDGLSPADKTGITPEMVATAPVFTELYDAFQMFLAGGIWIIYNAEFDVRLLRQTCLKYGLPPIPSVGVNCAMKMFSYYLGEWNPDYQEFKSHKLEVACEHMGVELGQSHNALEDAKMLYRLVQKIAEAE